MSEMRIVPLVVVAVTLMGTWAGLVLTIPPDLVMASQAGTYKKPSVPKEFSALDITQIAWFDNHTIGPSYQSFPQGPNSPPNCVHFYLPPGAGANYELWAFWGIIEASQGKPVLYLKHIWYAWVFLQSHVVTGMKDEGYGWDKGEILNNWDANKNYSYVQAQCACGTVYFCYMTYNGTKYQSMGQALDAYDIFMLIGVGIKDTVAKINSWNVLGSILLFQVPDINPVLNFFIALPFYAGLGIMIYCLILMAIPFMG